MDVLAKVTITIIKLTLAAMVTSLAAFIVGMLCSWDWWIAVVVSVMTVATGLVVNKLTKGVY